MAAGILCSVALFEAGLRLFSTPLGGERYSWGIIVRQYMEGIASASFDNEGSRLTGNPPIPGAETALIIGDSHIEALQVADRETVGSILERKLRSDGHAINIRQYGWNFAAAPMYVFAAPKLLAEWNPKWVLVVMTANDMTLQAVEQDDPVGYNIQRDGTVSLKRTVNLDELVRPIPRRGLARTLFYGVMTNFNWAYRGWDRERAISGSFKSKRSNAASSDIVPGLSVRTLHQAFGDRLIIVYDAMTDDRSEALFDQACLSEHVTCMETREPIAALARKAQRVTRGFGNTAPGIGHYNSWGHRFLAETVYPLLVGRS